METTRSPSKENKLKIFISVDMEGISGIVHGIQTGQDQLDYGKGRTLMVGDVNAAIDGVLEYADAEITVADGHGGMKNIQPQDLRSVATLVRGTPKPLSQMAGIDESYDAALFIGYHSMKGTLHGIISHTFSGRTIHSLVVNGHEIGETAMNAAIAGYYQVPLVFVSGDLAVTREAKKINPNITTVAVKEAIGRTSAKCIHPEIARNRIQNGVAAALKQRKTIDPFTFQPPIKMQVTYTNALLADAVEFMPSAKRKNGRTIEFVLDDYLKAFGAFRASVYIASAVAR
ncbi:MAG: M55 family metallopeptidase [Candidatus Bathyarchaeota archaeon]|nr:MAG: M55 family metallopeptidase [Candidatus Bathyarchaeota archaeon]